jgi:hypothetical protein
MDASGTINWFELQLALRSAGQDATKAKEMVATADTDGDGEIDYDEFVQIINSDFQTDAWMMLSTSLKHKLVNKAMAVYLNVVPVVPVFPLAGNERPYPFPDPEGSSNCGKAVVGSWILSIAMNAFTGGMALPFLVIGDLYLMATASSAVALHIMGLKFVNMHGQNLGFWQLLPMGFLSLLFVALFGIEVWAAFCDPETRPLSLQVMGIRYRNKDDTTPPGFVAIDMQRLPPATLKRMNTNSSGGGGGGGNFLVIVVLLIIAAVAMAVAVGGA